MRIETAIDGDVAVITFANPPLNALDGALRAGLAQAMTQAIANGDVRVVVLAASGPDFCAGTTAEQTSPTLAELCEMIETSRKPVIAVLTGAVLGDGLDLALACHYRTASVGVRVGMPGVRLGLPPSGGATQRLPRLVGGAATLSLSLDGQAVPPMNGLLDDPAADGIEAAMRLATQPLSRRPTANRIEGLADPAGYMTAVKKARASIEGSPLLASEKIVTCVEGAMLLPMTTGLEMERAAYADCAATPASRALRHLARAEAQAWQVPQAAGGRAGALARIAILGGTDRAGELALSCLDAGLEVLLIELDPAGQAAVLERLLSLYDDAVARGTLGAEERDRRLMRIVPDAAFDDLSEVDAVWEAGADSPEVRSETWAAIGLLARPGALLLADGDTVPLAPLVTAAGRAGDMAGLHVVGPGHTGALVELVLSKDATPDTAAAALALVRRLGRRVILAQDRPGRVAHALSEVLERTIETLLIGGCRAGDIDTELTGYGFRMPPCETLDRRGIDRVLNHRRRVAGQGVATTPEVALLDALADSGLTGRAVGEGLYLWASDRAGGLAGEEADSGEGPLSESDEARALMLALAEDCDMAPLRLRAGKIADICAAALANAGAKMIESGAVLHPGDVDVAAVHALGFPRWRGGPMIAADLHGLVRIGHDLALLDTGGDLSPLFDELIKNGRGFCDMAEMAD
ncbi:enoyl-CoA hydratase-related protein [Oceaniovalibus sp. ACAM 378]|uniref:enoyl-CoA hydratase-related protein n=1 Tax=Oceaniovalibus sp. ACAM 378 TaxID=2599923 RepID=UPI0011DB5C5E|nr:enoyl-CoA hydratase-related protein [Oceaniovalibus sp. ACAM 378]TYB89706.1 hypothetical protein FQ320_06155 [Oceaniovalibus sp. ACAM 378]